METKELIYALSKKWRRAIQETETCLLMYEQTAKLTSDMPTLKRAYKKYKNAETEEIIIGNFISDIVPHHLLKWASDEMETRGEFYEDEEVA